MTLRACNPFNSEKYTSLVHDFIVFVTQYIQEYEINHCRGWAENLKSYRYKYRGGVADFQKGISTRLIFHEELRNALHTSDLEALQSTIAKIMRWGGMKTYKREPSDIINSFRILDSLENGYGEWKELIGNRIAATSKIYAMYAPRLWSIFDSRVGKAIQILVSLYQRDRNNTAEYLEFQCPPGRNREAMNGFKLLSSPQQAILGFLYASWLFRAIAAGLNEKRIPLPEPLQNERWWVDHIEMVFFMIGR